MGNSWGRGMSSQVSQSQQEFAAALHILLATLKNWGQGCRAPDAPAAFTPQ